jgi:hypothetical protein
MLTSANIKAMRAADAVLLRFSPENPGTLELQKKRERIDGFGEEVARVEIDARAILTNYGNHPNPEDEDNGRLAPAVSGRWCLTSTDFAPDWATIAALARPNDRIVQIWQIDNRSLLLMRARLTLHNVALRIERPTKHGPDKLLFFNLAASVMDPYSTADLVTREQPGSPASKR